jgi:hypothetical protein
MQKENDGINRLQRMLVSNAFAGRVRKRVKGAPLDMRRSVVGIWPAALRRQRPVRRSRRQEQARAGSSAAGAPRIRNSCFMFLLFSLYINEVIFDVEYL